MRIQGQYCGQARDWDFDAVRGDWYCKCGNYNKYYRQKCNRPSCDGTVLNRQLPSQKALEFHRSSKFPLSSEFAV